MATKHEERSSHFKPAKKQRLLDKEELTTNIVLIQKYEVAKNAGYRTVLAAALKKRQNYDKTLEPERQYKLVHPDGQSAQAIPGSVHTFFLWKGTNRIRRYTHELEIHRA